MPAGYSGTPLARKLNLHSGRRCWRRSMPDSVAALIGEQVEVAWLDQPAPELDWAHVFTVSRVELGILLEHTRPLLAPAGMIWASWPKRASKVKTDITEDVVRELAFPLDLVDVKVCAVDEVWSGLKLVIRRAKRG